VSSVGERSGTPQLAVYAASISVTEGMAQRLAQKLRDAGHTVNGVAPGPTESEMLADVPKNVVDHQLKTTAVQHHVGTTVGVAPTVLWLTSESSRWVSGQMISVPGGVLMLRGVAEDGYRCFDGSLSSW
jgi:3-oxoacyl-[acyl-carrier protein] reductase